MEGNMRLEFLLDEGKEFYGTLCVVEVERDYLKPMVWTRYWPICRSSKNDIRDCFGDLEQIQLLQLGNATYRATFVNGFTRELHLQDGGQTRPIKATESPLATPRVRPGIELKY